MDSSGVSGITEIPSEVAPKNSEQSVGQVSDEFNGKRILRRFDSLDLESSTVPGRHGHDSKVCLHSHKPNFPCMVSNSNNYVLLLSASYLTDLFELYSYNFYSYILNSNQVYLFFSFF